MSKTGKSPASLFQEIEKLPNLNLEQDPDFITDYLTGKIANDIQSLMEEKLISRAELAKRLGKSRQYVSRVLNETANFTLRSLAQISCALETDLNVNMKSKDKQEYISEHETFENNSIKETARVIPFQMDYVQIDQEGLEKNYKKLQNTVKGTEGYEEHYTA